MSSDDHPVLSATARPADRTEVTGPEATDVYDVWEPPVGRPARGTTIALVHGGFWRETYDRTHLQPLAAALAEDGFHVANLEYPRIGMPGGGWPGTGTAVAARVESVVADPRLPAQVVVAGHSAGGHLALWLASQPSPPCAAALALGPAADLRAVHALGLSQGAAEALLGSTPEADPEAWERADPGRRHVEVPSAVVTGARDEVIPEAVVTAYRETRRTDEPVRFATVATADHFDLVDPTHEAYLTLLAELEELGLHLR